MSRATAAVVCALTGLVVATRPASAEDPPTAEPPVDEAAPEGAEDAPADPDGTPEGDATAPDERTPETADPEPETPGAQPTEGEPPEAADASEPGVGDAAPSDADESPAASDPPRPSEAPADDRPPEAHDPERARLHQRLGRAYYGTGRFDEAARELQRAHRLSGDPELLHELFLAQRDAGRIDDAIEALERYLVEVPDTPDRERLTARLQNMRRLQARRDGGRTPTENAGEGPSEGQTTGAPDGEAETEVEAPAPAPRDLTDLDQEPGGRSVAPWIVMGLGTALLVSGAVTGGLALKAEKDLESVCDEAGACPAGSGFEADVDRGRTLATATDVLLGLGVAAMGAGIALYFLLDDLTARAPTRPEGPTASVGCAPGGCMGTMRMSF